MKSNYCNNGISIINPESLNYIDRSQLLHNRFGLIPVNIHDENKYIPYISEYNYDVLIEQKNNTNINQHIYDIENYDLYSDYEYDNDVEDNDVEDNGINDILQNYISNKQQIKLILFFTEHI